MHGNTVIFHSECYVGRSLGLLFSIHYPFVPWYSKRFNRITHKKKGLQSDSDMCEFQKLDNFVLCSFSTAIYARVLVCNIFCSAQVYCMTYTAHTHTFIFSLFRCSLLIPIWFIARLERKHQNRRRQLAWASAASMENLSRNSSPVSGSRVNARGGLRCSCFCASSASFDIPWYPKTQQPDGKGYSLSHIFMIFQITTGNITSAPFATIIVLRKNRKRTPFSNKPSKGISCNLSRQQQLHRRENRRQGMRKIQPER